MVDKVCPVNGLWLNKVCPVNGLWLNKVCPVTAMGDVLVEREFYYLLYGILHMQIG